MVAGGVDYANYSGSAKANIYDPVTGIWTPTGSLLALRYGHTATRLSNGNVLVVGGTDYQFMGYPVLDAELYNPATGTWTLTGSPIGPNPNGPTILLPNGTVLLAVWVFNPAPGDKSTAQIYYP